MGENYWSKKWLSRCCGFVLKRNLPILQEQGSNKSVSRARSAGWGWPVQNSAQTSNILQLKLKFYLSLSFHFSIFPLPTTICAEWAIIVCVIWCERGGHQLIKILNLLHLLHFQLPLLIIVEDTSHLKGFCSFIFLIKQLFSFKFY